MSAATVIDHEAGCSQYFHAILGALLNASNDEYEERLAEVLDYVSAKENTRAVTDTQVSLRHVMAAKENERKAIKKAIQKLTRFDMEEVGQAYHTRHEMKPADLGDWVSIYDVMEVVK